MYVATSNKMRGIEVGAGVFAPVAPEDFYEAVLDVRGFPAWAPGVRRVEVLSGEGGAGMVSEWEVSFLGFKRRVRSVLEEAEAPLPAALDVRRAHRGSGWVPNRAGRGRGSGPVRDRALAGGPVAGGPGPGRSRQRRRPRPTQACPLPARAARGGRRGAGLRRHASGGGSETGAALVGGLRPFENLR